MISILLVICCFNVLRSYNCLGRRPVIFTLCGEKTDFEVESLYLFTFLVFPGPSTLRFEMDKG